MLSNLGKTTKQSNETYTLQLGAKKTYVEPVPEADTAEWREHLREEIAEAHKEWINATRFFNVAVGEDQIDYAIFALITAEKRYEMLIRIAKRTCSAWPHWRGALQ
ncbi:DUF2508 family protein [Paenibacillus glycanilyticus]|uniref:DUF2508 family protein n=1 Tax=Paenibacillus glycanilyticus TaxID=126569 RepID=A0ABQ6GK64_9BACL|nr:DUF2508 family protein [Paenibacillus glycanilyticus]GLX71326.1 hypothetical protein MU1_56760 [Paenibacillus glycanilyticus]